MNIFKSIGTKSSYSILARLTEENVALSEDLQRMAEQNSSLSESLSREADESSSLRETIQILERENERLKGERDEIKDLYYKIILCEGWPPGHYYSPYPSIADIKAREEAIFSKEVARIPAVDMDDRGQRQIFESLAMYYPDMPFGPQKQEGARYFLENPAYPYADGIILHCMIRHLSPRRIVEVGCGYSSCAILDTNELFFGGGIKCTFVEPHPDLLLELKKPDDELDLVAANLQDVPLTLFSTLEPNDILFIDSSHVSKVCSDVNHIFFNILPSLKRGVWVHFHDVHYPFEYPKEWVYQGRAWTETYLLRAFLQYNKAFKIRLFMTYLAQFHLPLIEERMPLCLKNIGSSIWLQKTAERRRDDLPRGSARNA